MVCTKDWPQMCPKSNFPFTEKFKAGPSTVLAVILRLPHRAIISWVDSPISSEYFPTQGFVPQYPSLRNGHPLPQGRGQA